MTTDIAIDIGYGDIKCKVNNKLFKFDTAVCYAKNLYTDVGDVDIYTFEGKKYLIGEDALSEAFTTRDYLFLEKYAPLFIYKALEIAKVNIKNDINLITGLSLVDWKSRKEQFAKRISQFYINNKEINLNIHLVPQGKGIYNYCVEKNPNNKKIKLVIDDIGYNTHDRLVFNNGLPISQESYATNTGVNKIVTEIQTILSSEYNIDFSEQEIKKMLLTKSITIGGKKKDISFIIKEEIEKYFEFYMNEARSKKKGLLSRADKIIISGGGAYYLEQLSFPENVEFVNDDPYEYLNVLGYWTELSGEK